MALLDLPSSFSYPQHMSTLAIEFLIVSFSCQCLLIFQMKSFMTNKHWILLLLHNSVCRFTMSICQKHIQWVWLTLLDVETINGVTFETKHSFSIDNLIFFGSWLGILSSNPSSNKTRFVKSYQI